MTDNKQNARKQAQRRARQRKQRNRRIALTACLMIAVMVASIGGTLAWLTDQTTPVVNTFTVGDININLSESTGVQQQDGTRDYHFVPGATLAKDPKVSVTAGSEACYLFVHVVEANNTVLNTATGEKVINWSIASGWKPVMINGVAQTGYYYREVDVSKATTDAEYCVLSGGTDANLDGQVTVSTLVTKGMHDALSTNKPTLTFTAAAIQSDNVTDYADAWSKLPTGFTGETGA